jgi:hypothetical protein
VIAHPVWLVLPNTGQADNATEINPEGASYTGSTSNEYNGDFHAISHFFA